jgi:hypothetical protein
LHSPKERIVRVKSRWRQTDKPKTLEDVAGALAFIAWQIASNGAQNMQSSGWEVHSAAQRLDVIAEFLAFLIQAADRLAYSRMPDEERQRFMHALARHVVDTMEDNQIDILGPGDYRAAFVAKLNQRLEDYSEYGFTEQDGPDYTFLRYFGHSVSNVMGERDRPWAHAQVIDIEAPEALGTLKKAMQDLLRGAVSAG